MPIKISNCSFSYRRGLPVIEQLSISFDPGATVLLGPNGAGKSTLMAIAATALKPKSGDVRLGSVTASGRSAVRAYRRKVGWLPQQVRPVAGLKVREQVAYGGWLKGMGRDAAWEASLGALAKVRMTQLADRRSTELSGGQLRRLGIAQALVHDAEVVLLDEPTAGLDPAQRSAFRRLLTDLQDSVSFVVSTHQTEDLAASYRSVVVLDQGQVRYQGSIGEFLGRVPAGVSEERRAEAAYSELVAEEA
ncbi:ATP-binding cassette domain-containing protein [Kitasatospora sp. NPDC059795]|uniref:ATP-binding cassette domain-containing protein n=1 Tax=unclassified Kitasatospora TaxID=2633591 RepID=UPI00093ED4C5|nr:ATP-binding cassette domain-containing protein [Kitasatospora sp. CB01950]OKJ08186.1 ABC transporter [Kitasatospora sp. CB01950]